MIEKVNPQHPDKQADRIAGACVDLAYAKEIDPKIAVEVLISHGRCLIICESTVELNPDDVFEAVEHIVGQSVRIELLQTKQDKYLAENQSAGFRCGDNGIFRGMPLTEEQKRMSSIAHDIYKRYPYDGKYILDGDRLIICQSNAEPQTW